MKLSGKKVVVTGAAKNIGRGIALALAKEGADVIISYRVDEKEARNTVNEIKKLGGNCECLQADFSQRAGIEKFHQEAQKRLLQIDLLVNNAADYDTRSFLELDADTFDRLLKVGVSAPMLLTQLTAKHMIQHGIQGSIINITSISGNRPYPNRVAHSTAKAALNMFTQACALDLAVYGIRVNAIAPGKIVDRETPDEEIPLNRTGTPADVAAAVIYLATHAWVTGQILIVDGGQSLSF
jgi:NAD(P)-dependent dehydrogenase (short-subunit alcohol dehydrogenase family)